MNWRHLEFLHLVVETGSLTEAARLAGVSQPAVSQAMAGLAREAGEPLFARSGRRLVPTPRALEWAATAHRAKRMRMQIEQEMVLAPSAAGHKALRVGLSPAAGLLYAADIAHTVQAADPQALLSICGGSAQEMLAQLMRGELDLVVAPRPRGLELTGLVQHVMYTSHPQIYGRLQHPLAGVTSLKQVASAHWAVAGSSGTPGNVVEEAFRVRRWKPPMILFQCTDYAVLIATLAKTDLLGVIPHPRLVPDPHRMGIAPLAVAEGLPHYEVCLFWHRDRVQNTAPAMTPVVQMLMLAA